MNRIFGQSKPKPPPPNLADVLSNVDNRVESVDKKIDKLDAELRKYQQQLQKMRDSPAKQRVKMKALGILKQKKVYENQKEQLSNQSFNIEQTNFAIQTVRDSKSTVDAMKIGAKELKTEMKRIDLNNVEDLHDDLADLLASTDELQDILSQSYTTPNIDEDDLEQELMGLCDELGTDTTYLGDEFTAPSVPSGIPGESVPTPATGSMPSAVSHELNFFFRNCIHSLH
ncbi:Charged multivesicular body protein isoform 1 [Schistosoma japonicum]|uniref:Charged multivesicular body protein 5 n=1 Tax=Schistosoma japonicum TaxID=6182 RepID=A0A4Z2DJ49_SCHJA|nr:Charged multivesicular body protein isoform 1 [Schistosoma japonicum]